MRFSDIAAGFGRLLGCAAAISVVACGARSKLDVDTEVVQPTSTGGTNADTSRFSTGGLSFVGHSSGGTLSTGGARTFTAIGGEANSGGSQSTLIATGGKAHSGGRESTGGTQPLSATGGRALGGTASGGTPDTTSAFNGTGAAQTTGGAPVTTGGTRSAAGNSGVGGAPVATGGARSTGGNSSTGGAFSNLGSLTGDYDIALDTSDIDGCRTHQGLQHLNASIQKDSEGNTSVSVFSDWQYPAPNAVSITNDELAVTRTEAWMVNVLPSLRFKLGSDGFAGTGTADVVYLCPSGTRLMTVAAKIGPDITPPRLRIFSHNPWKVLAPFDLSLFEFSEPVIPEGAWFDVIHSFSDPSNSVSLHDAVSGGPIAHHWTNWPWGPPTVLAFDDRTAMNARWVALDFLLPFTDRSGNPAIADQAYFDVIDAGTPVPQLDFDETVKTCAYGNATELTSDSPNSPCESGKCLSLDYVTPTCLGDYNLDPSPPTFLTTRFDATASSGITVRYRILSTEPYSHDLQIQEAASCSHSDGELRTDLLPLALPYGIYDHATEWLTAPASWCLGPAPDIGLYLYLQESCSFPPAQFRLLIERIESAL